MPTSALTTVAATATCKDSRMADAVSAVTGAAFSGRIAWSACGSTRARGRRQEPDPRKNGSTVATDERLDEGPREGRLLRAGDDRRRVDHRSIAVFGRPEGFLDAGRSGRDVRGVDEPGV